jgi:hypothetical protein
MNNNGSVDINLTLAPAPTINLQLVGPAGAAGGSALATATTPGSIQLAGDITGTATAPLLKNTTNVINIVQNDSIVMAVALG